MKPLLPPETCGLVALALADAVITVTTAGIDLHAVLRSKIALTTLALMLIRALALTHEQLHPAASVVAVASAAAGVAAASLREFYVIDAWALVGAVVQIGVLARRQPKPEEEIDVGPWADYLRGAPPVLDMPRQMEELASIRTQIDDDSMIAAFVRVIAHHARQDEIVVGVFDDGRWRPLRIACDQNQSVRALVDSVKEAHRATTNLGKAPSPETIAAALGHEPFQAGVAFAKPPPNALDVLVVKTKSGFKTTKRLADQLETYLNASGDDVAAQVSLVDESTRRKILALGDGPAPPWDSQTTVWDRMLACGDGTALLDVNTSTQITYDQFHRASKFVANSIHCQPGDRIAIVMRRCLALPAAVYGVVGAGGAYVPVDPDYPHERRKAIFEDSEPVAVVLTTGLEDKVPVSLPTVVVDDTIYDAAVTPVIQTPPSPQDCVYVLFTSGTTGRPKGVAVPHLTLARRVSWFQRRYEKQLTGIAPPRDGSFDDASFSLQRRKLGCAKGIVLQKTPFVFGVSEWELFWPLTVGSCLAVPPHGIERDPSLLLEALRNVTVAFFAPSQLGAVLEVGAPQSLRLVVCCGEALPPAVVTQCSTEAPQALLANVYGPTEADITYWEAPAPRGVGCVPPPIQQVPIGRAVDHVRVVVLNSSKDDVAALGVPGELAFVGDVAVGYLNNTEATDKAFGPAPPKLARNESDRMYRTGDIVRFDCRNELRFLGRQDRQIKLRGLRIELGEIESKLNQIQGVKESVCTTIGEGAAMALVAYARTTLDGDTLRDELASSLPKYMVPSQIICVSEFPRTDRGKLDLKKLPSVKRHASEKPSSELEASLSTIFAEILGIEGVGRDDDFETLGGNSLLAGRATNLIRRRVEGASRIPGTTLYKHPTIRSLARVITEERSRHVHDEPVPLAPDTTYHARDPTRCAPLLIQIAGVVTFLGMRYMDWPAWYVLWCDLGVPRY
jgi:amino acid adenylation domain-containing protein